MKIVALLFLSLVSITSLSQRKELLPQEELIPFKSKGKWGASNLKGKLKISAKYQYLKPFYYGVAKVGKNGKHGVIDLKQKEVLPIIYDEISLITYNNKLGINIVAKKDNKIVVQVGEEIIVPLSEEYDGCFIVQDTLYTNAYYVVYKEQNAIKKFDVINSKGEKILKNIIADDLEIISKVRFEDMYKDIFRGVKYDCSYLSIDYSNINSYRSNKYEVCDFENCFIGVRKRQSKTTTYLAYYTINGDEIFGFNEKIESGEFLTNDLLLVKTFDDELNCKKPTKYGIYDLINKKYNIQPVYTFYKEESISILDIKKLSIKEKEYLKLTDDLIKNYNNLRSDSFRKNNNKALIDSLAILADNISMAYVGFSVNLDSYYFVNYYCLGNENNIKVFNSKVNIIAEANLKEGVIIPDYFLLTKNKDSIYVGIEVFNNTYRGKGILNVNTGEIVAKPIYTKIYESGGNITLINEIKKKIVTNFNFNKKVGKPLDFKLEEHLFDNIYTVSKTKSSYRYSKEYALYNTKEEKLITDYLYRTPKFKTINENTYIFLENKESRAYSIIDKTGKVIVSPTQAEIELEDVYSNQKFYFKTDKGYYGLDGTKFFK